mmetsp:Transcript_133223/g.414232  ORF Transcript_133223/g.414232 Transcript_133223/m.414232 type:complete len:227 (-) Transcript_133223:686-1366(-)
MSPRPPRRSLRSCSLCVDRSCANSSLEAVLNASDCASGCSRLTSSRALRSSRAKGSAELPVSMDEPTPPGDALSTLSLPRDAFSQGFRGVIVQLPLLELSESLVTAVVSWLIGGCGILFSGLREEASGAGFKTAQASAGGSREPRPPGAKRGSCSRSSAVGRESTHLLSKRCATSRSSSEPPDQSCQAGLCSMTWQASSKIDRAVKGKFSVQSSKHTHPSAHMSTW